MKRETYYHGAGMKWGIYNTVAKEFQFGICEDSPMLAEARLFFKIGDNARKYRFEARTLPRNGRAIKLHDEEREDTADVERDQG